MVGEKKRCLSPGSSFCTPSPYPSQVTGGLLTLGPPSSSTKRKGGPLVQLQLLVAAANL